MNIVVAYSTVNRGRTAFDYRREDLQAIPADAVFYVQKGKIKIVVASSQGKEAAATVLSAGELFGKGWLIGQSLRLTTTRAMVEGEVMRIGKAKMIRVLQAEPNFGELLIIHLLIRAIRAEEILADQLFNLTEKRLA